MFGVKPHVLNARNAALASADVALAVIAVGMGGGALDSLKRIVQSMPVEFPAALVIAHHVAPASALVPLLQSWSSSAALWTTPGTLLKAGGIYVCPPHQHIVINPDATLSLPVREPVKFVRPSIDWFFESVAASFTDRAIAVVLSGETGDGAHGAQLIEQVGGTVLIEDPATARHAEMPAAARQATRAARVLSPADLPRVIAETLHGMDFAREDGRNPSRRDSAWAALTKRGATLGVDHTLATSLNRRPLTSADESWVDVSGACPREKRYRAVAHSEYAISVAPGSAREERARRSSQTSP